MNPLNPPCPDWTLSIQIRLSLEEVEAVAAGEMPETVRTAIQAVCLEELPVLRGEVLPASVRKRRSA